MSNTVPFERIDAKYFRDAYFVSFPGLIHEAKDTDRVINNAISYVYAVFEGVQDMLSKGKDIAADMEKTHICYGLLTAWYIQDMFPHYAAKVPSMGGVPLTSKKIGPVTISYQKENAHKDYLLRMLLSNPFGVKARNMLRSSGKVHMLYR